MAKSSGGTRNYRGTPTQKKRESEYSSLMSSGDYIDGYKSASGGYYVLHKDHRDIVHSNGDYSNVAARKLADKGYVVTLGAEKSARLGEKTADGKIYETAVDFKTINKAGNNTIKKAIEDAWSQDVDTVVLYQHTKKMTRDYVESQLSLFSAKGPKKARETMKEVIVVGLSGNVHRHKLK